jgi:hypothetical protein
VREASLGRQSQAESLGKCERVVALPRDAINACALGPRSRRPFLLRSELGNDILAARPVCNWSRGRRQVRSGSEPTWSPHSPCSLAIHEMKSALLLTLSLLTSCFDLKPRRPECQLDRGRICPEEGSRCIEGQCYRTCDSLSCEKGERCYTVKRPAGCFVDVSGSFSLCSRPEELPALFASVGADWFDGKGPAGFSESARLREQLAKARQACKKTDAGCSSLCLSNRDCAGAGVCDCSAAIELVSGRAWAGFCTSP